MKNEFTPFEFEIHERKSSLDVLLELIRKKKMDIANLNISELTDQFMKYFENMKNKIDLEELSDYANMLSYLIELKTRSLIPDSNTDLKMKSHDFELEKANFIRRLLEHQMYKNAIPLLENHRLERQNYLDKFPEEYDDFLPEDIPLGKLPKRLSVDKLVEAFENLLQHQSIHQSLSQDVNLHAETQTYSVDVVVYDLLSKLREYGNKSILFSNLFFEFDLSKQNKEYFCMLFFIILWLINQNYVIFEEDESNTGDFNIKLNSEFINASDDTENFIASIRRDLFGEE
ncbi:MAG: segregation/condensation protein A [Ureaplasma sp.]|nr:segregation/condensation protein A [Ureaplasma sp.]